MAEHQAAGRQMKIYCLGRKGAVAMKRQFGDSVIKVMEDLDKPRLSFDKASAVAKDVLTMFEDGEFDAATLIYAEFQSAISAGGDAPANHSLCQQWMDSPDGNAEPVVRTRR